MKFFASCLDEYEDELIEQLKNDYRVQFYEDELIFCLECDRINLQNEYDDLYFVDANEVLFEIMLDGRQTMNDLDLQFNDMLKMCDYSKIMFYHRFNRLIREIKNRFDGLYGWNVDNYDEVKDIYYGYLCMVGKMKY